MLAGKVALVTGGGSGIGRATCHVLAREGATVVAADINYDTARETAAALGGSGGGGHLGLLLDVTSEESASAAVATICAKYNKPATCVVNCAGIFSSHNLQEMTQKAFMDVIDVNLKGTFLVTKLTTGAMLEAGLAGSVVNIASIAGKAGEPCTSHYCASKAAVEGFTRAIAKELAPKNIRCNAVLPGMIDTQIIEWYLATLSKKEHASVLAEIHLGRLGQPEEVGEVVAFLASDRASYVTGASVQCTGGLRI